MIRRLFPLAALSFLLATPAAAQPASGPGEGVVALDGGWRFARGDGTDRAGLPFDDSGWTDVPVPGDWEAVFSDHDGFGWYRRTVRLPAGTESGPVGIHFGTVGDAFEAYWNGVKIGSRGTFPPRFVEGVDPTLLLVPPEALALRKGGEHVLAVRVYNDYAYGGLIGGVKVGPYTMLAQQRSPGDMVIGGLVSFFLAIGVYHFAFFLRRRAARENLYFALLTLGVSIYGATYATATAELVLPYVNPYRLGLMALLAAGPFFVALVYDLFYLRTGRREKAAMLAFPVLVALAAVLPLGVLAKFNTWIDAGLAVGMLALVVRAALASSPHRPHARTLVLGTSAFAATFLYDLASEYGFVPVAQVLPGVSSLFWIGFLVFVVAVGIATAGKWALTEVTALVDPLTELSRRHVLEDAL
ncbi:MAG TPA: 7TM diverse intracellular signaling domain-containing protein, partial [Longimicrobiaceae bacterium]|nr:7TM diverse intracellular signaling domain-containing protein [Longimicrobiaceae bacterium]